MGEKFNNIGGAIPRSMSQATSYLPPDSDTGAPGFVNRAGFAVFSDSNGVSRNNFYGYWEPAGNRHSKHSTKHLKFAGIITQTNEGFGNRHEYKQITKTETMTGLARGGTLQVVNTFHTTISALSEVIIAGPEHFASKQEMEALLSPNFSGDRKKFLPAITLPVSQGNLTDMILAVAMATPATPVPGGVDPREHHRSQGLYHSIQHNANTLLAGGAPADMLNEFAWQVAHVAVETPRYRVQDTTESGDILTLISLY